LVSTTPVSGSASLNALAVFAASWPVIASTTNRVSTGFTAACSALISAIIASSMARRPAVSTISTSRNWRARHRSRRLTMSSGFWSARGREERHADLLGQRLQLLDRGRTIDVGLTTITRFLRRFSRRCLASLPTGGGLARALQARHQHHAGAGHIEVQLLVAPPRPSPRSARRGRL
jgi:hypothetical protein